jgi:hypothetical protein
LRKSGGGGIASSEERGEYRRDERLRASFAIVGCHCEGAYLKASPCATKGRKCERSITGKEWEEEKKM